MSDRKWHKGPPPFPGWWYCREAHRIQTDDDAYDYWRWYDGYTLSWAVDDDMLDIAAEHAAAHSCGVLFSKTLMWSWRWPENARVPRIDPRHAATQPAASEGPPCAS